MTIHDQIHARIEHFVAELEALVRAAAVDAVTRSLGGGAAAPKAFAPTPKQAARPTSSAKPKLGAKRDPKVIAGLVTRVGDYVEHHPGQGVEAIAAGLKVKTHDITLPITKLLASKSIKKKGEKRATKYFPA